MTSNSSVLTWTASPTRLRSCITSLLGSKRVQMRSTVSNQARPRWTTGSMASRGWSDTTWMLTPVSMDTVANECMARMLTAIVELRFGAGESLRDGAAEGHRAIGRAADYIHVRALALHDLARQIG